MLNACENPNCECENCNCENCNCQLGKTMYGMINKAIRTLVIREAGEEVWEQVLVASEIDEDVYEDLEGYDDGVTFALVGATSETLGVPPGDVLEMFGVYWAVDVAPKGYGEYFNAFGDDFESFVAGLDEMLSLIHI